MSPLLLIGLTVIAGTLAFLLTPAARWVAIKTGAVDQPGPRKVHQLPIPRLGGSAVIVAMLVTLLVAGVTGFIALPTRFMLGLSLGLLPVFVVSFIDDIQSVPAIVKFLVHGISAAVAVWFGFALDDTINILGRDFVIGWWALPISWFWIVGVTNAFNLTDGLDGLSAGLALISAMSLAAVAVFAFDTPQAVVSAVAVGALVGFLPFNTYPAKIFFGDTGAASIGFVLACLGLWGSSRLSSGMAVIVPIMVMGVPVADALMAIMRRTLGRILGSHRGIFVADQEHIHHRLLRKGIGHPRAVLLLYGVGLLIATVGVLSIFMTSGKSALMVVTLIVAAALAIRALDYDEFAVIRNGLVMRVYEVPALRTGAFRVFIDMALVGLAVYLAFVLKFDDWQLDVYRGVALNLVMLMLPMTLIAFLAFGLYNRSWRQSKVPDILLTAAAISTATLGGFLVTLVTFSNRPGLTYFLTYMLVLTALVMTVRMSFRMLIYWKAREKQGADRVLVYGADIQGAMALQELFWDREGAFQPVGFVDDDPKNLGRLINGFKVFGHVGHLERIAREQHVAGVVIGSQRLTDQQLASAMEQCARAGLWLKRLNIELHTLSTQVTEVPHQHPGSPLATPSR